MLYHTRPPVPVPTPIASEDVERVVPTGVLCGWPDFRGSELCTIAKTPLVEQYPKRELFSVMTNASLPLYPQPPIN